MFYRTEGERLFWPGVWPLSHRYWQPGGIAQTLRRDVDSNKGDKELVGYRRK